MQVLSLTAIRLPSVKKAGAVFTSMTNYLVPLFGVIIGVLSAHKPYSTTVWVALALILSAVAINQLLTLKIRKT